jgi:hypothetical protein
VFAGVEITDPDREVRPTPDGAFAYRVTRAEDGTETTDIAEVFVQPDRARVEFTALPDVAADAATAETLRVRPKAVRPPRTLVFVEDGAAVKRAVSVFETVVAALDGEER